MRSHQFAKITFLLLSCLAFCPTSVAADNSNRFEKGAERCFNDYLQFTDESLSAADDAASGARELAEQSFRCVRRYESKLPDLRSTRKSTQAKIWALEKKIEKLNEKKRNLKKRAKKVAPLDLQKAAELVLRREKVKEQIKKLKQRLRQLKRQKEGAKRCTPNKTQINIVFENNSDIPFIVYVRKSNGFYVELFDVHSRTTETWSLKLRTFYLTFGEGAKEAVFQLRTIINGNPVTVDATMRLKGVPKQKPCRATGRFEIFDDTFPVQTAQYYVFGVQAGNSPSYFIGTLLGVAKRTPCSFAGGGLDCTSKVTFDKLAGPFTSYSAAQQAFCNNITDHEFWQFTSCANRYLWNGADWYWGCEGSVTTAISKYCPNANTL